jgi:membrane fusion protein, heavy metal efflux system
MKQTPLINHGRAVARARLGAIFIGAALLAGGCGRHSDKDPNASAAAAPTAAAASSEPTIDLLPSQLNAIKIQPVGTYGFSVEKNAVGSIDFDDDLNVQVFPTVPGKLLKTFVELGDEVKKGQPLYTIDSPDLANAESTLIATAGTGQMTTKELARAKDLYATAVGVSQRELEQATTDQQTAEGALKAARDAVRVLGKTEAEIDQIIASRKIDSALAVRSPISGEVTAYNAPPGYFVQPGTPPAPLAVADVSIKWMLANVSESDSPLYQPGQPVEARVTAYADRVFKGKIAKIYAAVDPGTHRVTIRSEIADPNHELRPGMLADFVIQVREPVEATAIPANGVVREGDGTLTAWVTSDRHRFVQKVIKVGLRKDGMDQIIEGLQPGQLVVSDGAVFLSNMLTATPDD